MPKPAWAIEGLFELNSLVMLAGPPASYKSFMALDWVLCMCAGRKWNSRPTVPSRVLYVLGEGKSSLLKRIQAWKAHNQPTEEELSRLYENFRVTFEVPQMAIKASVDNMLAGLADEKFAPTVVVVDTFARSFVGLDENSQKDTGLWVESAERLRALGYTVIFLHHTKKNVEFGLQYRGSTVIMGAMDTAMTMVKSKGMVTLEIVKQKDHDEGDPMYFKRVQTPVEDDPEGSIVLVPTILTDERFMSKTNSIDGTITGLVADNTYKTDSDRAAKLVEMFGMSKPAAKQRISRYRRETLNVVDEGNFAQAEL